MNTRRSIIHDQFRQRQQTQNSKSLTLKTQVRKNPTRYKLSHTSHISYILYTYYLARWSLDTLNDKTNNRKDRTYLVKNIKFWLWLIELERSQVPRPCRQHVSRTAWHVTFCCDTSIDNQTWQRNPWLNHSSLSNKQLRHERGAW